MRHFFFLAVAVTVSTVLLSACGSSDEGFGPVSDGTQSGSDSGTSGGTSQQACVDYCGALTSKAEGCEHYNDGHRCEYICGFYGKSACEAEWSAFTECMTREVKAQCVKPDGSTKLALDVFGCQDSFTTWHDCRDEKHASPCPY